MSQLVATTRGIAVVGSIMMDFVAYSPRIPAIGETITGTKFQKNFGGKGANQAVMIANLHTKVTMFCKVGTDSFGDEYLANLESVGVTVRSRRAAAGISTGIACITVDAQGSNSIVIIPGANTTITEDEVQHASWKDEILQCNVVVCQNEIGRAGTETTLRLIREHGNTGTHHVISIFNPAPATPDCLALASLADVVCPNETELRLLTGLPTTNDGEVEAAARALFSSTECQVIVVTLGARGACVATRAPAVAAGAESTGVASQCEISFVGAPSVHCVDTVGAGDCFIGSLASRLNAAFFGGTAPAMATTTGVAACCIAAPAHRAVLLDCVQFAIRCASISVTREGSQISYPRISELQ